LGFLGGIGDDLLCTTAVAEWLKRGTKRVWFFTRFPSLYRYEANVRLLPEDGRFRRLAERLGQPMRPLSYSEFDPVTDRDTPLREHILADMCRRAGLSGEVDLRPYVAVDPDFPLPPGAVAGGLVFQSSGLSAALPMANKQWPAERMQTVVDHFSRRLPCLQLGSKNDPPLKGAVDLRGGSLRQSAAVLYHSRLFVGTVGFPMHLARSVDCPAVIVYGGREVPELTGYSANVNLVNQPECSPCWQRNRCDFGRKCLNAIEPSAVIEGVERQLARPRSPLPVDRVKVKPIA
jgi:ADP-heptose:LPS heptosyltransferase